VADIGRHYDSFCAAKSYLGGFIGIVIPELRVEIVDRKLCVFPVKAFEKRVSSREEAIIFKNWDNNSFAE